MKPYILNKGFGNFLANLKNLMVFVSFNNSRALASV